MTFEKDRQENATISNIPRIDFLFLLDNVIEHLFLLRVLSELCGCCLIYYRFNMTLVTPEIFYTIEVKQYVKV